MSRKGGADIVTRKELAARAQVSATTVTRVLNGGYVSESTRRRVMDLVRELDYIPNALAQGLRTRRSNQIACIVISLDSPFYGPMMLGVEEVARQHGYGLAVYSTSVVEQSHAATFYTGRHDGVILMSVDYQPFLHQMQQVQVPVVVYADFLVPPAFSTVGIDLEAAVEEVVEYLAGLGHTKIGYVGTEYSTDTLNPRLVGFRTGMKKLGLEVESTQVQLISGTGTMESGYTGMADMYRQCPGVTAIVAMNDLVGLGAMRWMQEQGLGVPNDISIVGCDDIPFTSMCNPPMSTIHIPKQEIGRKLMSMLLTKMNTAVAEPSRIVLPTRLVARSSSSNAKRN